ncbi:MAG: RNA methyltransferase [Clostridia bacterium]|nr:RNA methyltransferase [Clostridia bacterium]
MEIIQSLKNPKIQKWRSLSQRKAREETGCFLVEGKRAVTDALQSGYTMEALILESTQPFPETFDCSCPAYQVPSHVMEALCDTKTPQGICAVMHKKTQTVSGQHLVVLDALQDPGNVGTIIRTADAAGLDGVILSSRCPDIYAPKVLRATMGSIFHIPCETADSLETRLQALSEKGYALLSTELDGQPFFSYVSRAPKDWCLIIGNEGHGVSESVRRLASCHLKLPMRGQAESLNASVAAGIMMYVLMEHAG